MSTQQVAALQRIRWAVRATLLLGVAASVSANVLHANRNPISQAIAAWPPLALLLTVELISRVPAHRRTLAAVRLFATATIAAIAAWVSYWHMAAVASHYGETGAAGYLLPVSVDGLVVVASVCLVELAGRFRDLQTTTVHTGQMTAVDVGQNGWRAEPTAAGAAPGHALVLAGPVAPASPDAVAAADPVPGQGPTRRPGVAPVPPDAFTRHNTPTDHKGGTRG